jgi:hypothetical protein
MADIRSLEQTLFDNLAWKLCDDSPNLDLTVKLHIVLPEKVS